MIDPAVRRRLVINRVSWRIIPFVFISYVVAYVDRVNIGFAADALERDLGLSHTQYGIGAGLFFLGYCLFEVPSNLLLDKVGARRWIARIMIGWGIASMLTMFVQRRRRTFYLARVVLGIAEAGFFPGVVLYLTYWVPAAGARPHRRALHDGGAGGDHRRRAGLGSGAEPGRLDGPARVAVAVPARRAAGGGARLPRAARADRPARNRPTWLPDDDREWLSRTMSEERALRSQVGHVSIVRAAWPAAASGCCALVYFLNTTVTYGIFLWLPKILRRRLGPRAATR